MRFLSLMSVALLASCASSQLDQVSKSYPEVQASGISLPAVQSFAALPAAPVNHSNTALAELFLRLEFQLESGRHLLKLSRFEGPISVELTGNIPSGAQTELNRLIARFQSEAGLDVRSTTGTNSASINVNFVPGAEMKRLVPTAACFVVPGVRSLAEYRDARGTSTTDWASITLRTQVSVFIPENTSPQEIRDCLNEEIAQAMGPLNDLYELGDSVFNDDNFNTVLTSFDMLMLRLHYAPELRSGMNEAQVASLLPGLLARYNPQGAAGAGAAPSRSPNAWSNLVAQAMGMGGASGRTAAADDMIQMAMAQGWNDTRLGLAYFLAGRLAARSNPTLAINYFARASQVYRSCTPPMSMCNWRHYRFPPTRMSRLLPSSIARFRR
jgi:hypothetical protein